MTNQPDAPAPPEQSAKVSWGARIRHPMFLWIAGIMSLVLGMNILILWVSLDAGPRLVTPDYYERGLAYQQVIDARARSLATGWKLRVDAAPVAGGGLALHVSDAAGRPVAGLRGWVDAYRPDDPRLDQRLVVGEDGAAAGSYRASFSRNAPGLWRLTVSLHRPQATPEPAPANGLPSPHALLYETVAFVAR